MLVVLALQQALARWVFRNQGAAPTQRKTGTKKGPKKGPKKDKRAPKEKEAIEEFVLTEGMEGEVVNPEIAVAFLRRQYGDEIADKFAARHGVKVGVSDSMRED